MQILPPNKSIQLFRFVSFSVEGCKRLRRALPLLLFPLLAGLQGCVPLPLINGETVYVMVVTQRRLDWLRRDDTEALFWKPLMDEFHRLHPNVQVSTYTVDEEAAPDELKRRTARGLGPDLILARAPMVNTLLSEGLIAPVPNTPSMRRTIASVSPRFLKRVRLSSGLSGLPFNELVSLACYNRQKIPTPPRTTDELMALAAAGQTVGLSIDPYGIWWTAGTRGADHAMVSVLTGVPPTRQAERAKDEAVIVAWLTWLRQIAQQSRVDLASGPEELTKGLIAGRLDWIPCFSLTLNSLQNAMGDRLGVSALPTGPGGGPSPFNSLQVWAFGLDSSASQRQSASSLVQLSLEPFLQRRLVLDTQEVLPVNLTVQTPVASSGVLAALAEAHQQFLAGSPLLTKPFTLVHLSELSHRLEAVIQQVMVGVLTPQEGARQMIRLGGGGT